MQNTANSSVMKSVFLRKGEETDKTRIVANNLLRHKVPFDLEKGETIIVEYFGSITEWTVISNLKIVFGTNSEINCIPIGSLKWVTSDFTGKLSGVVTPKTEMRYLILQLQNREEKLLATEVGPPFWGIYSMLQFAIQNSHSSTQKNQ